MTTEKQLTAIYDQNSHTLYITGLRNATTKALISTGVTVTAKICPSGTATPVTNGSIGLSAVMGFPGDWSGAFPKTIAVTVGSPYDAIVEADGGASLFGHWVIECKVIVRKP